MKTAPATFILEVKKGCILHESTLREDVAGHSPGGEYMFGRITHQVESQLINKRDNAFSPSAGLEIIFANGGAATKDPEAKGASACGAWTEDGGSKQ